MYFGDGVYATFDGIDIELNANGVGPDATDTIHLEPGMLDLMIKWRDGGYTDYHSGRKFGE